MDVRTGTLRVATLFPNPQNLLRPGQFGRVRAEMGIKKDAMVIPQRAVTEVQGRYLVAVVGPDNKVAIRQVKVGRAVRAALGHRRGSEARGKGRRRRDPEGPGRDGGEPEALRRVEARRPPGGTETRAEAGGQTPAQTGKEVNRHGQIFHRTGPSSPSSSRSSWSSWAWCPSSRLPIAQYPNIVPPEIFINTTYVGADAQTVEQSVATPIEQEMSGVDNMNYMYSLNANNGELKLYVNFDVKTDPNIDQVLAQMRQEPGRVQAAPGCAQLRRHGEKVAASPPHARDLSLLRRAPTTQRSWPTTPTSI